MIINLVFSVIIVIAFISLGKIISQYIIKLDYGNFLTDIILCFGIGAGTFALLVFFLGIWHLLHRGIFLLLIFILNLVYIKHLHFKNIVKVYENFKELKSLYKAIWAVMFFCVLLNIAGSFVPPTESDVLQYHLLIPKYYLVEGGIFNLSQIVRYSVFPQLMEMLFLVGMLLKSDIVAQLIHTFFGVFTALTLFLLSKKHFNYKIALIGMLIFYVSPVTRRLSGTAMVDLGLAFYFIVSGLAVINWIRTGNKKWLILYAIFCAFSFGVKYTGVFSLFWLPLSIIFKNLINRDFKVRNYLSHFILPAISFILIISPWLIRNYVYAGNPVSPFLYKQFGGSNWNQYLDNDWKLHLKGGVETAGIWDFLKQKGKFIIKIFEHVPLIIAGLFAAFFKYKDKRRITMFLFLTAIVYIVAGAAVTPRTYRFYLPAIAVMSIVSAIVYNRLFELNSRLILKVVRIIVMLFLIGGLSNRVFETAKAAGNRYRVISGLQSREEYLQKELDCYGLAGYINKNLSWKDRILSLNETRGYYFNCRFLVSHEVLPGSIVHTSKDVNEIVKLFKDYGIEYIFLSTTEYYRDHQRSTVLLEDRNLQKNFKLVATDGICYLYRL